MFRKAGDQRILGQIVRMPSVRSIFSTRYAQTFRGEEGRGGGGKEDGSKFFVSFSQFLPKSFNSSLIWIRVINIYSIKSDDEKLLFDRRGSILEREKIGERWIFAKIIRIIKKNEQKTETKKQRKRRKRKKMDDRVCEGEKWRIKWKWRGEEEENEGETIVEDYRARSNLIGARIDTFDIDRSFQPREL